jgi:hypothetical protein
MLGLVLAIGFFSLEARPHAHRHRSGEGIRVHDHLLIGPHHHRDEAAEEGGQHGQSPVDSETNDLYLGQLELPLLHIDDAGAQPSRPIPVCKLPEGVACRVAGSAVLGPASPRAPPRTPSVLV